MTRSKPRREIAAAARCRDLKSYAALGDVARFMAIGRQLASPRTWRRIDGLELLPNFPV
jgi:hypothetical protein